jgi:Probable Zinc-ribbon domain
MVNNRFKGNGCPYCSGHQVTKETCLAVKNPILAREWHPTKNGSLLPSDVLPQSNMKVWWRCKNGHDWTATIDNRSNGRGCPDCGNKRPSKGYCLAMANPSLAKEWHPTRNGKLIPKDVMPKSQKKAWWQCKKGHEWKATVSNRNHKKHPTSCPYCNGQRVCKDNCLATKNPQLAKEWHSSRNGKLTPMDVMPKSHKKAWWQCDKGHEWETVIASRSKNGCPYCAGRKSNSKQLVLL